MDKAKPKPIALIPIKERKREVLKELIEEWKSPYPDGLGDEIMEGLLQQMVANSEETLDTLPYKNYMLLFHIIEERYRQERRRKMLATQGSSQ